MAASMLLHKSQQKGDNSYSKWKKNEKILCNMRINFKTAEIILTTLEQKHVIF